MPLAATQSALQSQIANAFNLQQAATPDLKALVITAAIASVAPSGLFPPSPSPVPLIPAGFSACQSMLKNAFSLQQAATPDLVGQIFASAIALLVPNVPPVGQSLLATQVSSAFNLQQAATPDLVGMMLATAIISYYTMGGVI
jgi:hypothetical protein